MQELDLLRWHRDGFGIALGGKCNSHKMHMGVAHEGVTVWPTARLVLFSMERPVGSTLGKKTIPVMDISVHSKTYQM